MPPEDTRRSTRDIPTSSTQRDIRRLEKGKADKATTDLKFKELDKDVDEIKDIALSARKSAKEPHMCNQEGRLESVEKKSSGWSKFFRGLVISVAIGGFVAGGYFVKIELTKADKVEVEAVKKDVASMKSDINEVTKSQARIEKQLAPEAQLEQERKRMEIIKDAMKEAFVEADIKTN